MDELDEQFDADQDNFKRAMGHLIDSVSHFTATGSDDLTEIAPEDWAQMLEVLQFATFVVSGLMYSYGINLCGHDHEDEEN